MKGAEQNSLGLSNGLFMSSEPPAGADSTANHPRAGPFQVCPVLTSITET